MICNIKRLPHISSTSGEPTIELELEDKVLGVVVGEDMILVGRFCDDIVVVWGKVKVYQEVETQEYGLLVRLNIKGRKASFSL